MMAFLAKPAIKYGLIAVALVGLVIAVALYIRGTYKAGESAGAAKVGIEVQKETIKQVEGARQEKEKANGAVRDKPIDSVIEGLK